MIEGDVTPPQLDPSPSVLYEQTGGGDAYRVAMLDHGYIQPVAPWNLKSPGKRAMQCGLVHDFNWSEWRVYEDAGRKFEGRYCRTCATTNVREVPNQERDPASWPELGRFPIEFGNDLSLRPSNPAKNRVD